MAVTRIRAVDSTEKWFLWVLSGIALVIAIVAGVWLARVLLHQGDRLTPDFWKQILTALGLSTLALAGITVQLPRYSGGKAWAKVALGAVSVAFVLILVVVAVSLRELAIPATETSRTGFGSIVVACLGVTITLGGIVVGGAATMLDKIDVTD
jgi:hypothetical protein